MAFSVTWGFTIWMLPADNFGLSMAIGSLPTSLERLVRAFGALAEDGAAR